MLFIDGENFTFRAENFARAEGLILEPGPYYEPDAFMWMPSALPETFWAYCGENAKRLGSLEPRAVRSHYYTSVVGSDEKRDDIRGALWRLGFSPSVFRKDKGTKRAKGVDVTLTKDVLSHAYQDNYDVAFLVAGDGDYVPLAEEVKRRGKILFVAFFDGDPAVVGLSPELRLAADRFFEMNASFLATWKAHADQKKS